MIPKVFLIKFTNIHKNRKLCIPSLKISASIENLLKFGEMFFIIILTTSLVAAAPHLASDNALSNTLNHAAWPPMKHYDIWSDPKPNIKRTNQRYDNDNEIENEFEFESDPLSHQSLYEKVKVASNSFFTDSDIKINTTQTSDLLNTSKRQEKVIHLFPVPVDGECLSDDGRRTGTCFNAYECRNKGGQAKGECALGFGVCCIFIASCNETISQNITYLVSPSFPSFMPNNVTNCNLKIKLLNDDVSQLRIDFYHFMLGQPNRRTGVCDGDVFQVSGGPGGTFSLCGQNSGQHMYYDVGGRMLPRQTLYGSLRPLRYEDIYPGRNGTNDTSMEIDLNLNLAPRFLPTRLWEIRIAQIPFSQRAPAGCLQYFTGTDGLFQTFNFADNGRHLANQNYRICMRQEVDMCSIVYQPCDEQSFRIGPSAGSNGPFSGGTSGGGGGGGGAGVGAGGGGGGAGGVGVDSTNMGDVMLQMGSVNNPTLMDQMQMQVLSDDVGTMQMATTSGPTTAATSSSTLQSTSTTAQASSTTAVAIDSTTVSTNVSALASQSTTASVAADDPAESSAAPAASSEAPTASSTTAISSSTALSDDVEGSGGDTDDGNTRFRPTPGSSNVSRRPRPTRGGFDLLGFLRSAFDFGLRSGRQMSPLNDRQKRQFYSNCRDRITMPCIVEDFIGTGLGPLPGCEPVHCGMQFCSSGIWPCRIESTVTPFYVGIHFGDGMGKGSAEDNIGACLRFQQVQCM